MEIELIRVDGAVKINPAPLYLLDYLQYSRRGFAMQNYQRVNDFQKRLLYDQDEDGGIITLAGFFPKICKLIDKHNDLKIIHDHRTPMPAPNWENIKNMNWEAIGSTGLRDYQVDTVLEMVNKAQLENGIINTTGATGKSVYAACLYGAYQQLNTILAVPLKEVYNELYTKFKGLFPHKHIGRVGDGIHDISNDITITTYKSIRSCAIEKCQLLLADEIQSSTGDQTSKIFCSIFPIRAFGFSATIKNLFNQAEKLLKGMFGEVIVTMPYREAEELGAVLPGAVYFVQMPSDQLLVTASTIEGKISQGIKNCKYRNWLIGEICRTIPRDYQTIVFLDHIADHLPKLYAEMPVGTKFFHRGSSKADYKGFALTGKQQKQVIEEFKGNGFQHLIMSDCGRAGVNILNARVIVQAAGGSSEVEVLQEAYRCSRTLPEAVRTEMGVSEKTHFVLIDFLDSHDQALEGMSYKRMAAYREQGWHVQIVKDIKSINWTECPK
jgi:superfamily II DNA or RNA helicase